jgi:4-amino-4-deoxy-L-arabinose transferase-like glycosyltransferase
METTRPRLPDPAALVFLTVGVLTALRLGAVFLTPLELYPDEAQYWLWSRELAFGYYSKPPMIAWLIAGTTAIGGDAEAWIRVSSSLLHAGTALVLFAAGSRLYDRWSGAAGALVYSMMPGVQLSSVIASTDAPLFFFLALALLAYSALLRGGGRGRLAWAAALGVTLGLAFLSKYAAIYFAGGLALHALLSREARAAWGRVAPVLAAAAALLALTPNLLWNASHRFATLSHTADNADWGSGRGLDLGPMLEFVGSQFGVFGPLAFALLLTGTFLAARRRRAPDADLALLCLALPALLIVTGQAFLSRANANWAGVAFVPASLLVGAWLVRWRAKRTAAALALVQGGLALAFFIGVAWPPLGDRMGLGNSFKRTRGWQAATEAVIARAEAEVERGGLSAIAVDERFLFNSISYYGRDWLARPGSPPLRAWVREITPRSQAETETPLTPELGRRVLVASLVPRFRPEIRWDFARTGAVQDASVQLDDRRTRDLQLFVGEGFSPRPRDPVTGPIAP